MIETALFFGSFNPIHKGHAAVARAAVERGFCDEMWFVVSPLNPLKDRSLVLDKFSRLDMVELAIESMDCGERIKSCDVEFSMPEPSYTVDTLALLAGKYPSRQFSIVMGSDGMVGFDRWKSYREILDGHKIIVYPRKGYDVPQEFEGSVTLLEDVPFVDASSTMIRDAIASCSDIDDLLERSVKEYIVNNNLWGASSVCVESDIARLSHLIEQQPDNPALYMERGAAYQKAGSKDKALNDFLKVVELDPGNVQAGERAKMLREIFEYAYREIYNP